MLALRATSFLPHRMRTGIFTRKSFGKGGRKRTKARYQLIIPVNPPQARQACLYSSKSVMLKVPC